MRKAENARLDATLAPRPDSVRLARELIRSLYAESFIAADADSALLLVSELVSNAILHARSTIRLTATGTGDRLRVEVTDASTRLPLAHHHSPDAVTGRGLPLLAQLADSWGFDVLRPDGKTVWFELGARRAP
jgi:anti-sigma regulatory factor (Ser/Thr protein kinase)